MATPTRFCVAAPADTGRRSKNLARSCHSVVCRAEVPVDAGTVLGNLLSASASGRWPGLAHVQPWTAALSAGSGDAAAIARVRQEAGRPVNAASPPVRVVLVTYPDGLSDLVVVALRSVLGGADLRALAGFLLSGSQATPEHTTPEHTTPEHTTAEHTVPTQAVPEPVAPPAAGVQGPAERRPCLGWGLGEPARSGRVREVIVPLPDALRPDRSLLIGAVALVSARYGDGLTAAVTVLDAEGTGDTMSVCEVILDQQPSQGQQPWPDQPSSEGSPSTAKTIGAYLARWDGPFRDTPSENRQAVPVGVVLTQARPGMWSRPFLAPALPLVVHWERRQDGSVRGVVSYDEGEVDPDIARGFARHVAQVVGQLSGDPAGSLDSVALMTDAETREVLLMGSPPDAGSLRGARETIHGRFEAVARDRPEAIALTEATGSLSYAELNRRADLMAAGLRTLGATAGTLVGVGLERSAELVVVLLAVLKAGSAYVPMDLGYPQERLRYTVHDAGAKVVVAQAGAFPTVDGVRVVTPAELSELGQEQPSLPPADGPEVSSAAYVIYTSGSTGRPKGVVVPHRNVGALVDATAGDFSLGAKDVWTFFHSAAFDFSVWEIWGCLLTGGRLVVLDYWQTRDFDLFHKILVTEAVTVLNQTPSAFEQLAEADRRAPVDLAVRLVIFGGEPLDVRILAGWFTRHSHTRCRLVNMYGITETTVHVTRQDVTPTEMVSASRSVGHPLPGWRISVRDPWGRVLPPGAAGEICVGGAGVADGYLGQPELTAAKFVNDPHQGGRVYRSGDLGRLRPDGRLDHLGRIDNQVKLRGFRIELDEIRNVFLRHPSVAGAAAVLGCATPGDPATARIDMFVVLRDGTPLAALLDHARRSLPSYMLPATLTEVTSIPLTVNGKLDATALPTPTVANQMRDTGIPRTAGIPGTAETTFGDGADPVSAQILALWSSALQVEVRPADNFFEMGGNSLMVVRLLREMRERGLPRVSAQDFYRNSTAAQFIELVRS